MPRNRAWRRFQRQRIIANRLFIARDVWGYTNHIYEWTWLKNGSRLAKYNFTCDSRMCKLAGEESKKDKRRRESIKHPVEYE